MLLGPPSPTRLKHLRTGDVQQNVDGASNFQDFGMCYEFQAQGFTEGRVPLAVGETAILLHPPSAFSWGSNRDGEEVSAR